MFQHAVTVYLNETISFLCRFFVATVLYVIYTVLAKNYYCRFFVCSIILVLYILYSGHST